MHKARRVRKGAQLYPIGTINSEAIQEIRACLPAGRTLFHARPDRYAVWLLAHAVAQYPTVAALRRSPYAPLLQKPTVRALLAHAGGGVLLPELFAGYWDLGGPTYRLTLGTWGNLRRYREETLRRHGRYWAEYTLHAALWFVCEELGIRRIWYHTFESGLALKDIRYSHPPRSLYTTLPRRFCFQQVAGWPAFLACRRTRRVARTDGLQMYRLDL